MSGSTDVSGAADALAGAIEGRRDGVAVPALHALGHVAGADAAGDLLAIIQDGGASDAVRVAAADARGVRGSRVAVTTMFPPKNVVRGAHGELASDKLAQELDDLVLRSVLCVGRTGCGGGHNCGVCVRPPIS